MNNKEAIRVLIESTRCDENAIIAGFQQVKALCEQCRSACDVVVLVPALANVRRTSFSSVLGEEKAKKLTKGSMISFSEKSTLRLKTQQTFKEHHSESIVFAVYANMKMMDLIDEKSGLIGIVTIPFVEGGLNSWEQSWSPVSNIEEASVKRSPIADPIIVVAFEGLTSFVNLSNGTLNSSDKSQTDKIIRILCHKDHVARAEDIRSWCIGNGWPPKMADEVKMLWSRLYALTNKPKVSEKQLANEMYKRWRSQSQSKNKN